MSKLRLAISIVLVLTALLFVLGQVGTPLWYTDLFSHFQLQYLIVFSLCFIALYALRDNAYSLLALFFALASLSLITPYLSGAKYLSADTSDLSSTLEGVPVRILFHNMWIANTSYPKITNLINSEDPDILILAEVAGKTYKELVEKLSDEYPYHAFAGAKSYLDVAYFSKLQPLDAEVVYSKGDERAPTLRLSYNIEGKELVIYGVHTSAPLNREKSLARDNHLADLGARLALEEKQVVLVGDLNLSPWSPRYRSFTDLSGLVDLRVGRGLLASWSQYLPVITRIPIDHALATPALTIAGLRLGDPAGSDHAPIVLDVILD